MLLPIVVLLQLCCALSWKITSKHAAVTLVTGVDSGYSSGAIALGQSLIDVGSKLRRVVMVTPEVPKETRDSMSKIWEVREVQPIACNHKLDPSVTPDKFNRKDENYLRSVKEKELTCTKFAAWTLHDFDRVVFIDADILLVGPIDETLYEFSNASFVAAPEVFPPDNFNSGFIVLNPSKSQFKRILEANKRVGSAEGGDQGVFNNGVCPQWYYADKDDPDCGRLPWMYNVEVAHYSTYVTLRQMSGQRLPAAIHFVSDGKPWKVVVLEYVTDQERNTVVSDHTKSEIAKQAQAHLMWRKAFSKGTQQPIKNDYLLSLMQKKEYLNAFPTIENELKKHKSKKSKNKDTNTKASSKKQKTKKLKKSGGKSGKTKKAKK